MANEIHIDYDSGYTLYFIIRNSAGLPWDTTGEAFESWNAMGDYDVSMTDMSGSRYMGSIPANLAAGRYSIQVFLQAGGSPADGDQFLGGREIVWNSTAEEYVLDTSGRIDVGLWLGTACSTPTVAGVPEVDAILGNGVALISLANINAEVDTALADLNLDHFIQVSSLIRNDSTVSTATVLYTELSEATADHYNNMTILFTSGILAGQARRISDYSNDATDGIVTVYPAFTDVPGDNDTFIIIPPYFYMPLAGAKEFTYTVTSGGNPVVGVEVWISTDIGGSQIVWNGTSNASGVILDVGGNKPWLDPGTYYVWKQKAGYIDDDWPDTEVHS